MPLGDALSWGHKDSDRSVTLAFGYLRRACSGVVNHWAAALAAPSHPTEQVHPSLGDLFRGQSEFSSHQHLRGGGKRERERVQREG